MRRVCCAAAVALAVTGCGAPAGPVRDAVPPTSPLVETTREQYEANARLLQLQRRHLRWTEEDELFADAARAAWTFVERHRQSSTGLVAPVRNYFMATMWDVGGMLAALYAAHELGLVPRGEYERQAEAIFDTLLRMRLYDDVLFSRVYDTRTGGMIHERRSAVPVVGWSATDLGRLLIWLKIFAADPRFARGVERIVARNDLSRAVRGGYLWGADLDPFGRPFVYQEGRIGYEQYAAQGFDLWGHRAERALSLHENAAPVVVFDQVLPADLRRGDRLTNEPFLLTGLELGWDRDTAAVMRRLLAAQQARFQRTGQLTLTGEDAIERPPYYFYYYCVYTNGKQFGVDVQDRTAVVDGPRWVSTKAAFALHALLPSGYSWLALERLQPARDPEGWASGVHEGSGRSTGTPNINTAAVVLTAALVHRVGEPILAYARRTAAARAQLNRS